MNRRKSALWVISVALFLLMLTACSAPASDNPKFPTGKFMDTSNQYVGYIFKEDNTWQYLDYGSIGAEGTYKVKGNQWINEGDEDCPFPGTYEWSFDGTNLKFKLVGEDKCDPRREATDGQTFVLTK